MPTSTTTKERGWPAHAHEVCAILDGRQTQFRRPMKPQPPQGTNTVAWNTSNEAFVPWNWNGNVGSYAGGSRTGKPITCPFGKPGDRLWVRETWGEMQWVNLISGGPLSTAIEYRAGPHAFGRDEPHGWTEGSKWKPSIHMKRKDSRINLEVTGVRVERVQEISAVEAYVEGCLAPLSAHVVGLMLGEDDHTPIKQFTELWDSINAKRGFGWDKNPWTWVTSFERIKP